MHNQIMIDACFNGCINIKAFEDDVLLDDANNIYQSSFDLKLHVFSEKLNVIEFELF